MNRRQRKKQFKKRYGFNPPRSFSIQTATRIAENRVYIRAGAETQAVYSVGGIPNKGIIAAAAAGKRGKAN